MNSESSEKDHEIIKLIESVAKGPDIISKQFYWLSSLEDDKKIKLGFVEIGYQFRELAYLLKNKLKLV